LVNGNDFYFRFTLNLIVLTTEKHSVDLRLVFTSLPGSNVLLVPDAPKFTILAVSDDYLYATRRTKEELIGKGLFDAFPNNPDDPNKTSENTVRASLEYAMHHKEPHYLPIQRYDIPTTDGYEIRYWLASNRPVMAANGEISYLIHTVEDVTDRTRIEEREARVKNMEKAYRVFVNAPVIIGIVRGDEYVIELANEGLLEVWGRTKEVIGKPLLQAIPELKEQGFIALLDQVRKTGEPFHGNEIPIQLVRNGRLETLYFDFVYKPHYEDEDEDVASAVIAVGHDVTEKILARKKVQESEEKYRSIFETMDQGFCILEILNDDNGVPYDYRFVEVNPVFAKQTGLNDATGKTIKELVPNIEHHWIERYARVAQTGEAIRFTQESAVMGKWFDAYAFRIGEENNPRVALLFTDISEHRNAELALRASEERLQKTVSIETVGVIYFDLDGVIHDGNAAFARMSGYTLEEIRTNGIRWDVLTPPEFMEVTMHSREELLTKGQNTPYEKQYIRPDGSRWWGLFAGKRLSDNECVEFVVDITETKEIEHRLEEKVKERTRDLEKLNEELMRTNANLEEFTYAASHDLKEPVRKIHVFSDRLKHSLLSKMTETEKNFFERIELASKRMSGLIDDLLTYSEVGHQTRFAEDVDMNQVIKQVIHDLDLEIEQKNAMIEVDQLFAVPGHHRQLLQAFQNLLSNALKYSRQDVAPVIRIRCNRVKGSEAKIPLTTEDFEREFYQISVSDNGIGFPQEDAERIFNVFTRLHGKTEYKGTGIGLSIVRRVIQNHHGFIWAESKPNEGATFHILLPVSR
jgi:PAS domain S-box-containing protein